MHKISDKKGVQQLIQRLKQVGVHHVVISPGSRNAPLIVSFSQDPYFTTYNIPDERSAAFYALGMAEELNQPVAIACTSGSAILNYYPAIAEAFYRCIPLIVLSADRPEEWIDHGDGQTIRQRGVLKNHILAEMDLIEHLENPQEEIANLKELDRVVQYVVQPWKGPVHINCPFNEPLYGSVSVDEMIAVNEIAYSIQEHVEIDMNLLNELKETWAASKNIMILCGQLPYDESLRNALNTLADYNHIAILVENTSNLVGQRFIHCIDRTLNSIEEENLPHFQPDLLITIGGAVVSKRIKSFLRAAEGMIHWKIGFDFPEMDTYRHLSHSICMSPNQFVRMLPFSSESNQVSRFGEQWKQLDYLIQFKHEQFFEEAGYSDIHAFNLILDCVPDESKLHMGNSSVVRYCQLFDPIKSIRYTSNRGTSGIDGSTSTAIGAAIVNPDMIHTLITGDISFFYDSNALWNKHLPSNVRIILINNGGGNIFKIIPGPDSTDELEEHFVAQHDFNASQICAAFHVAYHAVSSIDELEDAMSTFYQIDHQNRPVLLEVFTSSNLNPQELKRYFKAVKVEARRFS
jgi:2-succinyl-5-enolpyruvyl-6-hydroxy-3-cyclohexene-1-carboxylate synthase